MTMNGSSMNMSMNDTMGGMDMGGMHMNMMSDGQWYEPGVAMYIILDHGYVWTSRVFDIISILTVLTVVIIHLYTLWTFDAEYEKNRRNGESTKSSKDLSVFSNSTNTNKNKSRANTFSRQKSVDVRRNPAIQRWTALLNSLTIIYAFVIISVIALVLLTSTGYSSTSQSMADKNTSCDALVKALCTLFHFSKSIFYSILITRLQVAFGVSALRYSSRIIYSLYGFVIVYTLFLCIGTLLAINGMLMSMGGDEYICHIHIHDNTTVEVGVFLWIFMDMVVSVILLYLFQKPIRGLYLITSALQRVNTKLGDLMTKYAILTWLSVLWALLSLLLYLWKHITILIEVGGPLSVICVVLMHSKYKTVYNLMCSPCIKCVLCSCAEERNDKRDEMGQVINEQTANDAGLHSISNGSNGRFSPPSPRTII